MPTLDLLAADLDAAVTACARKARCRGPWAGRADRARIPAQLRRRAGIRECWSTSRRACSTGPDRSRPRLFGAFPAGHALGLEAQYPRRLRRVRGRPSRHAATPPAAAPPIATTWRHGATCTQLAAASMLASLAQHDRPRLPRRPGLRCRSPLLVDPRRRQPPVRRPAARARWLHAARCPVRKLIRYPKADHAPHAADACRALRGLSPPSRRGRGSCARPGGARDDASVSRRRRQGRLPVAARACLAARPCPSNLSESRRTWRAAARASIPALVAPWERRDCPPSAPPIRSPPFARRRCARLPRAGSCASSPSRRC